MRKFWIGTAVLFILSALPLRAEEWTHTYPVNGKPELYVETNDGDVNISTGSSEQISVRVTVRGMKISDLNINGNQSGNRVDLNVRKPNHVCIGFCFNEIHIDVQVPRNADLNLRSGDGNLQVENVKGNLQLETSDGDVRLHEIEGSLHANTHDGNIDVRGQFDMLSLRTGDGNIDGEIRASNSPQPGWMIRTGDGNLHLRLPDNFAADLTAHTGDGSVRVDFPMTTSGTMSEHSVRGKINGGGLSLELQSGDGDIEVEKM